jgi:hypothetical protein
VRTIRRFTIALAVGAAAITIPVAAAGAAKPVVQACVGSTFAQTAAALPGGDLGQTIRGFAQAPEDRPGIGDGIQALQAGVVDDDTAANTCND